MYVGCLFLTVDLAPDVQLNLCMLNDCNSECPPYWLLHEYTYVHRFTSHRLANIVCAN